MFFASLLQALSEGSEKGHRTSRRKAAGAPQRRRLIVRFESEGITKAARIALAYLHECLSSDAASLMLVAEVREYLEKLPRNPNSTFVPSSQPSN